MKQIIPTTQYKKDLKRYANQRKKMEALLDILRCLANEEPNPRKLSSTFIDRTIQRLHGMSYRR